MTDFFTHCWRSARPDLLVACVLALILGLTPALAADPEPGSEVTLLRLARSGDGLDLYATVSLDLPSAVEDALEKGIPMVFLAEADVMRNRWYWADKKVASVQRHMRLAFQPLTRRWRLNVASGPMGNNTLGLALNLNFDSLQEAMATVQRISGWKIADMAQIDAQGSYRVDFRFSLDLSQLPRPFQIGAFGQSDWKVAVAGSRQLGPESTK